MGNRSRWNAMVMALAMVSGCHTGTTQDSGGARVLTAVEMDQVTAGSAVAVNEAAARALGFAPQTAVSATTQAYSGTSPIAAAPFVNYATAQATASAGNGEVAQAGLSSHISVDGVNGGAWIDAAAAGNGASHTQVSSQTYGISTSRADLVFGWVAAAACCGSSATAQVEIDGGAGGPYSRQLLSARGSDTSGQPETRVGMAVVSSALPIVDPAQVLVAGASARVSPKY